MRNGRNLLNRILLVASLLATLSVPAFAAAKRRPSRAADLSHFCDYGSDIPGLTVPSELCIRKYADVLTPRTLVFAPNGDLFVASPQRGTPGSAPAGLGAIVMFRQPDATQPPQKFVFAQGNAYESVHGLLVGSDKLYYTIADAVFSVPYTAGDTTIAAASPTKLASLVMGDFSARWTHTLAAASDGTLLVSRGQYDNTTCPTPDPHTSSVLRIGAGHSTAGDVVITGLRNPMYIRCMPWNTCYAAELSGDSWVGYGGKEKLVVIKDGDNFGYPCCIEKGVPNPELGRSVDCSQVSISQTTFALHDTPFGFDWERDFGWPAPYNHAFFVALHGEFGSWKNAGVSWSGTDAVTHMPSSNLTPLLGGSTGDGQRGGVIKRVADAIFAPDGRLFICDDQSGAIYWIAPRTLKRPVR